MVVIASTFDLYKGSKLMRKELVVIFVSIN